MTTLLGIFVKQPQPGRVKTRLAADIGEAQAASLYAAFVSDVLVLVDGIADRRVLSFAPATVAAGEWAAEVAGDAFCPHPQVDGDLGLRISAFFGEALRGETERAVLIGSDSPGLPRGLVEQAFTELLENDVVLGPATDGGFYLVGLRSQPPDLFDAIDWSSPRVFEQTVDRVRACGCSLAVLPVWYDVDTADDARMLWAHLRAGHLAGSETGPKKTLAVLEEIFGQADTGRSGSGP